MSALAPFDNDLHGSNIADVPILVRHGAEDDNVPVYHSRVFAAVIDAWAGNESMVKCDQLRSGLRTVL
jgi:predicted esterase